MDGFVEAIKLVGAVLGIATAFFIVYDRLFRDRPIFSFQVRRPVGAASSVENDIYLRIKNVSDEDIVIDEISITPPHLTFSVDGEVRSIAEAIVRDFNQIVVGSLAERLLILIVTSNDQQSEYIPVTISATWRGTRRPWPWKRHVRIRTTVASIAKLKSATADERIV
jgi:hypothetical protein